jgi:hypothetical protein
MSAPSPPVDAEVQTNSQPSEAEVGSLKSAFSSPA